MKYLRKYNESSLEMKQDLKDILLELEEHSNIRVSFGNYGTNLTFLTFFLRENAFSLSGETTNAFFSFDEIADIIFRIKDFVEVMKSDYLGISDMSINFERLQISTNWDPHPDPSIKKENMKVDLKDEKAVYKILKGIRITKLEIYIIGREGKKKLTSQ